MMLVDVFQLKEQYQQLFHHTMMINVNFHVTSNEEYFDFSIKNKISSSLTIGHLIGKGAFGFVYQGLAKGLNSDEKVTTVAIKTVRGKLIFIKKKSKQIFLSIQSDDATPDEIENLLKELSVMKMVGKHINIISLLGCCTKGGKNFCSIFQLSFKKKTNYS